ncbi:3D domain-containing protein [Desulfosporosinus sp. Sb-LF]|uniref:G5 and 3D domain-containing protein n=1 Tax=Desulfosporosinus sp. Sb-LF TaxID=2560027 RepID=UPI00107F1F91|nr:3D domain-containing protein [Desulfosporosinus sp. Sb-LF]TGE34058.1 hypothetical protein E4K68_04515 [Desulfosporosinus sp. Sb-LF]
MYLLPVTTYSDYWRATKVWSSYLGGLALFAASTRYSILSAPDITQTLQQPLQVTQSGLNTETLDIDSELIGSRQKAIKKSSISRGVSSEPLLNRGMASPITQRLQTEDREIPFETQYVESDQLLPGMSQIKEEGERGILRQVVKTFEVDGQPVDQQIQSSFELKRAKKKVVIQNSKPPLGEKFELAKMNIGQTLNVVSTAYTHTGSKTASGVAPREGLIAVDPKVIAMGSKVYVEGYGYAIAADTGGDIRGNRIDLFFSSLRQCIDWGRKPVRIYVLKPYNGN